MLSGKAAEERSWLLLAAFGFVVFSLVALAIIPTILLQRFSDATEEIATKLLPSYVETRELALAMEERITLARSLLLTDDPAYVRRYERARQIEEQALSAIDSVAPKLNTAAERHVDRLLYHAARRDSLEALVLEEGGGVDRYLAALPRFDAIRDSMLVELKGFDQELMRISGARLDQEARMAVLQRRVTYLLGTLALMAALLIAWFSRQQFRLRREVQAALEEANRQRVLAERQGQDLQRATEARGHLLRGVTHDIKNPLGAARGYTELLMLEIKAPLAPGQKPLLEGILRSLDEALSIIADLLDLARADSGGLRVERVECTVGLLVTEAVEDHRSAAEAAGHRVEVLRSDHPITAYTDPTRVGQVLGNLLSNAIKYTPPPGHITVRSRIETREDGGRWATIRVDDTGPGIPPHLREAVFDEFTRIDEGGGAGGHGLGLAIARRIARLLDGDLTVEDAESGGASFVLWLPVRRADEEVSGGG